MSDAAEPITPARAAELFEEAVSYPARRDDAIGALFAGLAAAAQAGSERRRALREAQRKARRARPASVAARSAAARKGWETRRRKVEEALARDVEEWPARTGPVCDVMSNDSRGSEVFCRRTPGHHGDHEDDLGTEWPREDWEEGWEDDENDPPTPGAAR